MKMKPLVLRSAVIAALGGLLFGFDTAVISGTTEYLKVEFDLEGFGLGFTVATALIGTILGAVWSGVGKPADKYGRKKVLFAIGLLYFISAMGSALAPEWYSFMIFRFLGGIGVGAAASVAPIYNAEVAPSQHRGRLVGLFQFNVAFGILAAYISNLIILRVAPEETAWRWMFGVEAVPAIVFFFLMFTVPESPRWLMAAGRTEEADDTLQKLATTDEEFTFERREIIEQLEQDYAAERTPFFARAHTKVIMLAFAIAMFNQLSGINAVLYYAPDIFVSAGLGQSASFLSSSGVGLVMLVATVLALGAIDKFGRRTLMLWGSIGYLVTLGLLAFVFLVFGDDMSGGSTAIVIGSLFLYVAAHGFGQGAVIWVFISEIFPNAIRARGQSFGSLTHWLFAAIISWGFPPIAGSIGPGVAFSFFFVCMIAQLIWVLKVMPETKGVPLEEMKGVLGLEASPAVDVEPGRARVNPTDVER